MDAGEDGVQDEIRPAQEIARRCLALFAVVGTALGVPRDEVVSWLRTERLWDALTPHEVAYLDQENPPRKVHINFDWQSERLIVLLWALGLIQIVQERHHAINWIPEYLAQTNSPPRGDRFTTSRMG